jgi:threonine dehydrogenase-like Zn-dependent dehydrogenase
MLGHMMYVREDYRIAIELLASGKIRTEKTITKVFPFDDYVKAFEYADVNPDSIMKLLITL